MARILSRAVFVALCLLVFQSLAGSHWVGTGDRVVAWTNGVAADRVRLGVRDEGVYRVTAGEIAAASGLSSNAVVAAWVAGGVSLSCQGRPVAWTTSGDALLFYGVPTPVLYAPENVYWLSFAAGARMERFAATPEPGAATNAWFMRTESYRSAFLAPYDYKDRRSSNATMTNVLIFGEWIAGSAAESLRAQERTVALPGFCPEAETGCVARVSAASYYDFDAPDTHACEVWLNGTNVGSQSWPDERAVTFDYAVPQGVVTNGAAQLKIRNGLTATINDFLLLDVSLAYPCRYSPSNGVLRCTGGAGGTLAAAGFGTPDIRVWDVTEADAPLELTGVAAPDTNGLWGVAFLCGDAGSRYAVFEEPAGCYEPSVCGVRDTDWSDPAEMPELAIVTPPRRWVSGFEAAAQPLADLRSAQGLRTRVIDAEELYNAFTDGQVHPEAFRRFCAAGVTNGPAQRLKYVLFAGLAGGDYKLEVFGFGEKGRYPSLFPLYYHAHIEHDDTIPIHNATLYPSDPVLGDVAGDAVPEVAVGRFLATNALELTYMVAKTIRYELTATWKNRGIFVACRQVYPWDINFSNFVAQTVSGFEAGGWTAKCFYPKPAPNDAMNVLWEDYDGTGAAFELASGAGFFYYFGHSNDEYLGTGGSVGNTFVKPATLRAGTWPFAPAALLMGCRIGRWTFLDLKDFRQCVAEASLKNPTSGFCAVVSPSGYMESSVANGFSNGFRDAMAARALRLGDAYLAGFAKVGSAASVNLRHMTLLGDPALTVRAGQTARGTPAQWLIAEGLTNNPYADLEDPDGDGFATWMEVQAGTDHRSKGVKVCGLGPRASSEDGCTLTFEPVGGRSYRVMATTNLASGAWERVPWRESAEVPWTEAGIPVGWPVRTVTVPYDGVGQRFYKVQADE